MSDETPGEDTPTEETPADETPTTETPAADAPPPAASAPPAERSGFFVPKWLAGVIAALLLLGAGFGIGRATDSDGDHHMGERAEQGDRPDRRSLPQLPQMPGNPGGGNGDGSNGNGNGGNGPQATSGAFLGVAARDATGDQDGAEVVQVVPGGPADDAGITSGDVITKVDSETVSSASELGQAIQSHSSGDEITITYVRNGTSTDVTVTLRDRAAGNPSSGPSSSSDSTN
jgi:membrane-associated protease RseP (regulator of RpoE activity)